MKLLIVTNGFPPSATGGVEVYSQDLALSLLNKEVEVSVLARETNIKLKDYQLLVEKLNDIKIYKIINDFKELKNFEQFYINHEINKIYESIIEDIHPDVVLFNHLIGLSVSLPLITKQNKIPYFVMLHDYWPLCQRVNLINSKNKICPGPKAGGNCFDCLTNNSINITKFSDISFLLIKKLIPYYLRQKIKEILGLRSSFYPTLPSNKYTLIKRFDNFYNSIINARAIFVPSLFVKNIYVRNGYPDGQIKVLPLGIREINHNKTHIKEVANEIRFGFIGTLIPIKGVDIVIKAFKKLPYTNIKLYIFGRDDVNINYTNYLYDLCKGDERIILKGKFHPDERDLIYSYIDYLIIPSISGESFSLVAREALIRNIPVIASDIGALSEVILPGKNGFLFQPGNINSLYKILSKIILSPSYKFNNVDSFSKIYTFDEHTDLLLQYIKE